MIEEEKMEAERDKKLSKGLENENKLMEGHSFLQIRSLWMRKLCQEMMSRDRKTKTLM